VTILRGVLALVVLLLIAFAVSDARRRIRLRTVLVALALEIAFSLLVLRWSPGRTALDWVAKQVQKLIEYAGQGTQFVFGPLTKVGAQQHQTIFALQVLPVIVFLGAIIQLLYFLRVIQYVTWAVGGAIRCCCTRTASSRSSPRS